MSAVDVLMPMRDAAPWVAAAWRSLERQSLRDWRLVAVDDGSRDGTGEVLAAAARGDPRLHLVRGPPRGVAAALNRGLAAVTAPVVVRMDADDLCHPRRLELLRGALREQPALDLVASRVRLFPPRAVPPAMARYLAWQNRLLTAGELRRERYVECTVTHAASAFRTALLHDVGGWWEGDGPEDLDLFLRLHRRGARFGKLPLVLYLWRERAGRETRTSPRMSASAFRRTKAHHLAAELRERGSGRATLFGRGRSLAAWGVEAGRQGLVAETRVLGPGDRPAPWEGLGLFCFGNPGVRDRVRRSLAGWVEDRDYLFVA